MTLPFQEETYSVSRLCEEVREVLREAWGEVWVSGEINRLRTHRSGHLYFELVEKGDDDRVVGKLEAVAWRNDSRRIRQELADSDQELVEGQTIRCRGGLDFYAPFGRAQLVVRQVDPVFTLGELARRRRETLLALTQAGLLDRNASLPLTALPLDLGLVTSQGSAAYHDFLSSLTESGYGFRVRFIHAAVQGRDAEAEMTTAIAALDGTNLDALVLIRGGGSRSDLAVFDSRRLAETIARATVPILTGLGHEIDESIADRVAHMAFRTPTKAAEFLVARVSTGDRVVAELGGNLGRRSLELVDRARRVVERSEHELGLARHRLLGASRELHLLARRLPPAAVALVRSQRRRLVVAPRRLVSAAPLVIERSGQVPSRLVARLVARAQTKLAEWKARLSERERMCVQLAPEKTLERGFSITRDASNRVLTDPRAVATGDRLVIRLAHGRLNGRVEEA